MYSCMWTCLVALLNKTKKKHQSDKTSFGALRFVTVGSYDGSVPLGRQLQLNQSNIIWTGHTEVRLNYFIICITIHFVRFSDSTVQHFSLLFRCPCLCAVNHAPQATGRLGVKASPNVASIVFPVQMERSVMRQVTCTSFNFQDVFSKKSSDS